MFWQRHVLSCTTSLSSLIMVPLTQIWCHKSQLLVHLWRSVILPQHLRERLPGGPNDNKVLMNTSFEHRKLYFPASSHFDLGKNREWANTLEYIRTRFSVFLSSMTPPFSRLAHPLSSIQNIFSLFSYLIDNLERRQLAREGSYCEGGFCIPLYLVSGIGTGTDISMVSSDSKSGNVRYQVVYVLPGFFFLFLMFIFLMFFFLLIYQIFSPDWIGHGFFTSANSVSLYFEWRPSIF